MSENSILQIKNLTTSFDIEFGTVNAVEGISFDVKKGKTLGIVGESGCGKSVTALSVMRLLPKPFGKIREGEILFGGLDIVQLPAHEMRKIRGNRISMIFQEPMTALNPVHTTGKQLSETFKLHFPEMSDTDILKASVDILKKVGIPAPEQRVTEFPHQLSGGMRQRVMIAIALVCKPDILIADEPTTALDVTIQAQILKLMKDLQDESGMSIIFITHDLGVIAETCDDVAVMYAGKIVEQASIFDIFDAPRHPYTKGLLKSIPQLSTIPKSKLFTIDGIVPDLSQLPKGCRFQNRCIYSIEECKHSSPPLEDVKNNHLVSCFNWRDLKNKKSRYV